MHINVTYFAASYAYVDAVNPCFRAKVYDLAQYKCADYAIFIIRSNSNVCDRIEQPPQNQSPPENGAADGHYDDGKNHAPTQPPSGAIVILHRPGGHISFNSGMRTVTRALGGVKGTRIPIPGKAINQFIRKTFPHGLTKADYIDLKGETFAMDALNRMCTRLSRLMDPGVPVRTLLNSGDALVSEVSQIVAMRTHLEEEDADAKNKGRPDLNGEINLWFRKYDKDGPSPDGAAKVVTITGYPQRDLVKQKHYWIYSSPGWGKSTVTRRKFVMQFNAAFLPHPKNACKVPKTAQFLVVDEVSPVERIPLTQLKRLTCGDASEGYINRKSYGESYVPRSDMQLIILSNHSPYEVYSKAMGGGRGMDGREGCRRVTKRTIDGITLKAIEDRFNIIRLDGPNSLVRRNFVEMKELSDADFDHLIRCQVFNRMRRTNNAGRLKMSHIVNVMTECFDLYLRREQEADEFIDTDMFMAYLQTIVPCEDWHVYEAAHK
jgi:hypothetical protein